MILIFNNWAASYRIGFRFYWELKKSVVVQFEYDRHCEERSNLLILINI